MNGNTFVLDASELPRGGDQYEHPLWWGIAGMLAIETTVFTCLVVSYFYLRMGADAWPPEPYAMPELLLPTLNTLVLVASSGVMVWGDRSSKKGEQRKLAIALTVSIGLAIVFLVLKAYEYLSEVGFGWEEHAYGSIVWTIVGFHSAHVTALVLKTIVMATLAWKSYFSPDNRIGVTVNGLYWHFVVVIWIPLYLVLYWAPRVL